MNRRERRAAAKKGRLELSARATDDVAVVCDPVLYEMHAGASGNANDTSDPSKAEPTYKAGRLLLESGKYQEALARFDLLQTMMPRRAEVFRDRGVCLYRLNRREAAAASYRKALEIEPRNHDYHNDLASILLGLRSFEEALVHFRKAIEIKPDFVAALNNLGIALVDLQRFEEALPVFNRGLSISPDLAQLFSNKANALKALGRHDEALAAYDRAIALKPDYVKAHCNRGACLDEMLRADEAFSSFKNALAFQSDYPEAHWNLGLNRLRVGDLKTGWIESEWRWKCPGLRLEERKIERPLWLGVEPLDGKVLLLHSDQGLGDALQFCRYAPLAAARGAKVILEVQRSLRDLLDGLAGVSMVISKGEALPDFDFHCPLCSLPLAFDTTIETIPSAAPYLSVDSRGKQWEGRLHSSGLPRIGLVWSGNPGHLNDRKRSIALKTLLPLLEVKAQFLSLQKDIRSGDLAVLRDRHDILDFGPELGNFSDTAALVAQLDLLISVDTSVAHLAGALGRPVWILLPYAPDWRWLLDRMDSPWYPTASLFRQSETREWGPVVLQVGEALRHFVDARSSPHLSGQVPPTHLAT